MILTGIDLQWLTATIFITDSNQILAVIIPYRGTTFIKYLGMKLLRRELP